MFNKIKVQDYMLLTYRQKNQGQNYPDYIK